MGSVCFAVLSRLFFLNDTAPTEIYTLSLHDALPISDAGDLPRCRRPRSLPREADQEHDRRSGRQRRRSCCWSASRDRKSTRLNSSHANISYAVFCLKKKKIVSTYKDTSNDDLAASAA